MGRKSETRHVTLEEIWSMEGRRWYDSSKVIWSLFGVVGFMLLAYAGALWAITRQAEAKNGEQDVKIQRIESEAGGIKGIFEVKFKAMDEKMAEQRAAVDRLDVRQGEMDRKIDKILDRLPPK